MVVYEQIGCRYAVPLSRVVEAAVRYTNGVPVTGRAEVRSISCAGPGVCCLRQDGGGEEAEHRGEENRDSRFRCGFQAEGEWMVLIMSNPSRK